MGFLAVSRERGSLIPWDLGQGPYPGSKELFSLHGTSSGHLTSPPAQRAAAVRDRLPECRAGAQAPSSGFLLQLHPVCWACGSSSLMVAPVYHELGVYLEVLPHSSTASSSQLHKIDLWAEVNWEEGFRHLCVCERSQGCLQVERLEL